VRGWAAAAPPFRAATTFESICSTETTGTRRNAELLGEINAQKKILRSALHLWPQTREMLSEKSRAH
jgi:hypothetical protein